MVLDGSCTVNGEQLEPYDMTVIPVTAYEVSN